MDGLLASYEDVLLNSLRNERERITQDDGSTIDSGRKRIGTAYLGFPNRISVDPHSDWLTVLAEYLYPSAHPYLWPILPDCSITLFRKKEVSIDPGDPAARK